MSELTSTTGKNSRVLAVVEWAAALLLAGVFGYAGASKLADPAAFQEAIDRYRLLPFGVTAAVALYLPWLEVLLAFALVVRKAPWRRAAAALCFLQMLVFTGAYVSTMARGLNIECGCFGKALEGWPAWAILLRDFVLLAASAFVAWYRRLRRDGNA